MSWNDADLAAWAERIRALSQLPTRAAELAASKIAGLVEQSFATGTDPYGRSWTPLASSTVARGRRPPPLTESGAMRGSLGVEATGGGRIEGQIAHPAQPHQTGWIGPRGSGPARPLAPTTAEGMPRAWSDACRDAVIEAVGTK